ncbi:MAG: SurA N-terminal domain-containing protein [Burkholderiaceae bacterium]
MFEFFRNHGKPFYAILFSLIILAFAAGGMSGYESMFNGGEDVAKVDGRKIKQTELDAAYKNELERIRAANPSVDIKLLDTPEAKYATLERLVREQVIGAAARDAHFETSDQRLANELQSDPTIASLRQPDGKIDKERYKLLVGSQGLTPEMFEARVRSQISARQVFKGIQGSGFTTNAVGDVALNAFLQKREVQVAVFDAASFASKVTLTDADLETYYKANQSLFQAPEQANIEYVVLDIETIKKGITVSDEELKSYYEQNQARLATQEERRASHILITSPKGAPAAEQDKAKAKAQALLDAVKKAPATFAEVAKANSQDPGSAVKGGDLDFFARGAMVKPFEDAAYALKKGDISALVESDFGFHIIQLTDIKVAKQKSFEEAKAELLEDAKKQQAQKKFAEMAETFTNAVYEQSDSLKPIAEKLKLEVKTASNVTRTAAVDATGVLANPKFLNAIFSADAIEKKRNTEAFELANKQLVSGRIAQYTAARTLPLAEMKDRVREKLLAVRSFELAKKEGMDKLAAWKAAPASAVMPAAVEVARNQPQNLPVQIVEAALKAETTKLPDFIGVELPGRAYYVAKINKVLPPVAADDATAKQGRVQVSQAWVAAEDQAYYNLLKERFKTDIKLAKPISKSNPLSQ